MAKSRNRELWENAIPLMEAWRVFSDKGSRLAGQPNGMDIFNELAPRSVGLSGILHAASVALQAQSNKRSLETEMRDALLDDLFNSDLTAVAYRAKPSHSSTPVIIDPNFFEFAEIEWVHNSAEYDGKRYNRIRVFDLYSQPITLQQKAGIPGSGEAIGATIEQLIREDSEFCNSPRKIQCDRIRKALVKRHILGNGLSDPNLAKYILKRCPMRKIK